MSSFYAVKAGRTPGIYKTWSECVEQVNKFSGAVYKKFKTLADAQAFVGGGVGSTNSQLPPSLAFHENSTSVTVNTLPQYNKNINNSPFRTPVPLKHIQSHQPQHPQTSTNSSIPPPQTADKKRKLSDSQDLYATIDSNGLLNELWCVGYITIPKVKQMYLDGQFDSMTDEYKKILQLLKYLPVQLPQLRGRQRGDPDKRLVVYTDGSCFNNGGWNAHKKKKGEVAGGIGVWFGKNDTRNVSEPFFFDGEEIAAEDMIEENIEDSSDDTGKLKPTKKKTKTSGNNKKLSHSTPTNNRAELAAILKALKITSSPSASQQPLEIRTDSKYCIKTFCMWLSKWILQNFSEHKENLALIKAIWGEICNRKARVYFRYVRGHSNDFGNKMADQLARQGSRDYLTAAMISK